jgi:hypothetical protein
MRFRRPDHGDVSCPAELAQSEYPGTQWTCPLVMSLVLIPFFERALLTASPREETPILGICWPGGAL